jgi:hypothetical protein
MPCEESACVITRLHLDVALYVPAPPPKPTQDGRPRKKGRRLPTLAHRVAAPTTPWKLVTVAPWYGQKERRVHMTSTTAVVNKAFIAMRDLEAGITYVNSSTIGAEVHLPFGGVKHTGNGHREGSQTVLDVFTEWMTLYIDYSGRLQKAQIDVG